MLIVDVDVVRLQALQRRVDGLADDRRTGIGNNGFVRRRRVQVEMDAELRANLDAIAEGLSASPRSVSLACGLSGVP